MKRRDFIKNTIPIASVPLMIGGMPVSAIAESQNLRELVNLLNDPSIRFDGIDGGFYFKNNMIERDLDILKISNGTASTVY